MVKGACVAKGGQGGHAWQGGMHGRGCMAGGSCMAAGMCGRGGACVAVETATAADSTHPTGMHSCSRRVQTSYNRIPDVLEERTVGMPLIITDVQPCAWLKSTSCWKICEYQEHP